MSYKQSTASEGSKDGYVIQEKELNADYMNSSHENEISTLEVNSPVDDNKPVIASLQVSQDDSAIASESLGTIAQTGDSFPINAIIGLALLVLGSGAYWIRRRVS